MIFQPGTGFALGKAEKMEKLAEAKTIIKNKELRPC